jgi:hypothetical protein
MPTLYTVKQSAELLETSTATLRRVADEFAAHLPDYQPVAGERRTFTDADLRTVYAILSRLQASPAQTRSELLQELSTVAGEMGTIVPKQTRSELLQELSTPDSEPLIIPAILPTDIPANAQNAPERPKADRAIVEGVASPQNALAPFLAAQADTRRQIEKLSAQMAELQARPATERPQNDQAERRQMWVLAIAVTLSIGLLLAGVTVSAILRDSQAALLTSVLALIVMIAAIVWPTLRR